MVYLSEKEELKKKVKQLEDQLKQQQNTANRKISDNTKQYSRRSFLKAAGAGAVGLGAAAMIGNTSAFRINSDQGLSYFNRSSNQSQFNVSPDGILDAKQIGTKKNPISSVHSKAVNTNELITKSRKPDVVVYKEGRDVVAVGTDGVVAEGTAPAPVIESAITDGAVVEIRGDYTTSQEITVSEKNFHIDASSATFTASGEHKVWHFFQALWGSFKAGLIDLGTQGTVGIDLHSSQQIDVECRMGDVPGGTFTEDDGVSAETYSRCAIRIKSRDNSATGVAGSYYNRVTVSRVFDTVADGDGIILTTTGGSATPTPNGNVIRPLHMPGYSTGLNIKAGGHNTVYSPEFSGSNTGVVTQEDVEIYGGIWLERCDTGINISTEGSVSIHGPVSFAGTTTNITGGGRFYRQDLTRNETTLPEEYTFHSEGEVSFNRDRDGATIPTLGNGFGGDGRDRNSKSLVSWESNYLALNTKKGGSTSFSESPDSGGYGEMYDSNLARYTGWDNSTTTFPVTIDVKPHGTVYNANYFWINFSRGHSPDSGYMLAISDDGGSTFDTVADTNEKPSRTVVHRNYVTGVDVLRLILKGGDSTQGDVRIGQIGFNNAYKDVAKSGYRLSKEGDTMYGALEMAGNNVTDLDQIKGQSIKSNVPSSPSAGDWYIDDGSNTASGNLAMRIYNGTAWIDQN